RVEPIYFTEDAPSLDGKFHDYYKNAIKYKLDDDQSYQRYWRPLQPHLEGVKKLYLAPDGIFHLINLPTLKNPATGDYLLDELEIQYFTSTQDVMEQRSEVDLKRSVLVGRPSYEIGEYRPQAVSSEGSRSFVRNFRNADITDLPGTEAEVKAIEGALQSRGLAVSTYLKAAATEDIIYDLEAPNILHIATHGYWSPIDGNTSSAFRSFNALVNAGLLLSGVVNYYQAPNFGKTHDGILTAYEAQQLNLEATDMVILSACETGLGSFDAGEGVYGLQRAFRTAGAASIITSLWKVDDEATKDFMIAFYDHYVQSGSKPEAFRVAQTKTREQYSHPYYWGAFVLVGK
ncbi:MAG: CHAT domain-containing protein, partial [Bacteroidota bacterium]